jgi:hypothetical protein
MKEHNRVDSHKANNDPGVKSSSEPAVVTESPDGSFDMAGDSSLASQALQLNDQQWPIAQKQALAEQIGETQGNQHLQRILNTVQRQGGGNKPPSSGEYVPEMSVKPDSAEIDLGAVHTEKLDILNVRNAPRGTAFHWGGGITTGKSLEFVDLAPNNSPHAKLKVKGVAPGTEPIDANTAHQVPGGPEVVTPGPKPPIAVKKPSFIRAISRETAQGAGNPSDPTRLSVGDGLVVRWIFKDVKNPNQLQSIFGWGGPGFGNILAAEPGGWPSATTFEQKFRAVAIGRATIKATFQFAQTTLDQAISDTFDAHVEMDRQQFINLCSQATGEALEGYLSLQKWMLGLSIAYGDAWKNHTDTLSEASADEKLAGDIILGAALAFIPGGVGGLVGESMKNAGSSTFMVDGVKDLAKWGLRAAGPGAAAAAAGGGTPGLKALPTDPLKWRDQIESRVVDESKAAVHNVNEWIDKANRSDPDFFLDFNPVDAMRGALQIGGTKVRDGLPAEDAGELARAFEKGMWAEWLKQYAYIVVENISAGIPTTNVRKNLPKAIEKRCKELGLDIGPYVQEAKARAEAREEAGERPDRVTSGIGG